MVVTSSEEEKDDNENILDFLDLLELNGERLSDVPEWRERMKVVLAQLPEHVVSGFAQRIKAADGRLVTDYRQFAQRFGLTQAETNLLAGLAGGLTLKEYAEKKGVSVNTARVHRQHILEKTEAQSQSDLLRMLYTS